MKIVTFNVRYRTEADGANYFDYRLPLILQTINEKKPDVIGFQEANSAMRAMLQQGMPEYVFVGGGREKNRQGESACIAYLRDRFLLAECDTFWLSPTPNQPGSRYTEDQSQCPRVCTCVLLTCVDSGASFRVYNLHTDHVGKRAREQASELLLQRIAQDRVCADLPLFVTGDLNANPDTKEILALSQSTDPILVDCTANLSNVTTFHDYGRAKEIYKIDYVFASEGIKTTPAALWTEQQGEVYLSDHYPVEIEVLNL